MLHQTTQLYYTVFALLCNTYAAEAEMTSYIIKYEIKSASSQSRLSS